MSSPTTNALSITLQLLSGDLLTLEVSSNQSIHHLPILVADQLKYNPSAVKRMRFFSKEDANSDEEEQKEQKEQKDFVEQYGQKTWAEVIPKETSSYDLYFLITAENDSDSVRKDRIKLIRKLLLDRRMYTTMIDDDLYSLYSEWNLHYLPQTKTNRYLNLTAFVEQNKDVFQKWTEEEWADMEKKKDEDRKQSVTNHISLLRFLDHFRLVNAFPIRE